MSKLERISASRTKNFIMTFDNNLIIFDKNKLMSFDILNKKETKSKLVKDIMLNGNTAEEINIIA